MYEAPGMKRIIIIIYALALIATGNINAQTARDRSVVETVVLQAVTALQSGDVDSAKSQLEYIDRKYPGNDAVN